MIMAIMIVRLMMCDADHGYEDSDCDDDCETVNETKMMMIFTDRIKMTVQIKRKSCCGFGFPMYSSLS